MNRIEHLVEPAKPIENVRIEGGQLRSGSADGLRNVVFTPLHYERNYAYPLIVWLHGPGSDEGQLSRIMPLVSMRNYVAVAPRGTLSAPGDSDAQRYAWAQTDDHICIAEHRVLTSIEDVKARLNISSARIYIAGYACGGTMALRLAFAHPDMFAGGISFGGELPSSGAPLARVLECRRLRLFLATARDSYTYPPAKVCNDLRLIHSAGIAVSLRQYPCGDELTTNMLADMDRWIMEHVTCAEPASQTADLRTL